MVVRRCHLGLPVVMRVPPLLDDGTPFPTLYWLTCPLAVKRVARIESSGGVGQFSKRAVADEEFRRGLLRAHDDYRRERNALLGESSDVSATPRGGVGGVRSSASVKCLHAHLAHTLSGGANPIGCQLLSDVFPLNCRVPCVAKGAVNEMWTEPKLDELEEAGLRAAAIDVGTNSTRLLVADVSTNYLPLWRETKITRLGYRVDETGYLDPEAVDRTLEAIGHQVDMARGFGAERLRIAATSACRDAANRLQFFEQVHAIAGIEPEILSGEKEAATTYLGATYEMEGDHLLIDIGGGSTEVVVGGDKFETVSMQIGCVRLTERFIDSDPPAPSALDGIKRLVGQELRVADCHLSVDRASQMIGVAGTVTTLAMISLGLKEYDPSLTHHHRLSLTEARRIHEELITIAAADRVRLYGIPEGRADVIVAGSSILLAAMEHWGFDQILVSERDILDGLVLSMAKDDE